MGYLLKEATFEEIVAAIRDVHHGKASVAAAVAEKLAQRSETPDLTQRELEVLQLLVSGSTNRDLAKSLFVSEENVKTHIKHILTKPGVNDRTQAMTVGLKPGLIRLRLRMFTLRPQ